MLLLKDVLKAEMANFRGDCVTTIFKVITCLLSKSFRREYNDHNPRVLSVASSFVLQSIHWVVTGLALRRAREISSQHFSQTP